METKITHEEFIEACQIRGIKISKISRNYVYVDLDHIDLTQITVISPLSNCRPDIYAGPIYPTIDICSLGWGSSNHKISLETAILENQKINAIKILRANFQLGLKQSIDLYDSNISEWKKEVLVFERTKRIDHVSRQLSCGYPEAS